MVGLCVSIAGGVCFVCQVKQRRRKAELKELELEGNNAPIGYAAISDAAKPDPKAELSAAVVPANMV